MSDADALVALTGLGLDHLNTLAPFELRPIVMAQGKQFRNGDPGSFFDMPAALRLPGSERVKVDPRMARISWWTCTGCRTC